MKYRGSGGATRKVLKFARKKKGQKENKTWQKGRKKMKRTKGKERRREDVQYCTYIEKEEEHG